MNNQWIPAARQMLSAVRSTTVILAGDFCLDVYYHIESAERELSVETGLPVRKVKTMLTSPGGAGNVFANLCALGCGRIIPVGVAGEDMFGNEIARLFAEIQADFINTLTIQKENWTTPCYMKPLLDGKEQERIDTGFKNKVSSATVEKLLAIIEQSLPKADIVLINQQLPDTIYTDTFIAGLNRLAKENPKIPFIVDARNLQSRFQGMWHKLNTHELAKELNIELDPRNSNVSINELRDMMIRFRRQTGDPLIVSRGEAGAILYNGEFVSAESLALLSELDTVGAGDSFLSGFALSLAAGLPMRESLYIANSVAGVTIRKLHQTGTCSPDELLHIMENVDLIYNTDASPALISEPFTMEIITSLEIIRKRPAIKYAIFDQDGTISVLREGWEEVMEKCMIEAITGGKSQEERLLSKIRKSCRNLITRTTGIQTINQMEWLVELVRKWDLIPAKEVLSPPEYKKIYNDALLAHIDKRIQYVRTGELLPEDMTLAGSLKFLKTLYENGVQMFLASGTDIEDVIAEAGLLGYIGNFTGGVHGSVGDPDNDPKRKVLKSILSKRDIDMECLVVFGDGPVEMREARKSGALAIGIAGNEVRKYGWNYSKRERLIRAGADILIPDWIEYKKIASFLLKKGFAD